MKKIVTLLTVAAFLVTGTYSCSQSGGVPPKKLSVWEEHQQVMDSLFAKGQPISPTDDDPRDPN